MTRLNIKDEIKLDTLDELIPAYAFNKDELDSYKKICDEENNKIKSLMMDAKCDNYTAGGFVAKKIIQHKESMNEDKLLAVLKQFNIPCTKTVEVVDMDALESYLYKNTDNLPAGFAEKLAACKTTTDVVQLRVSAVKKGKDCD